MMQVYFLSIVYLLVGASLLLVDHYGGKLLLVIRLRNLFKNSKGFRLLLIIGGFLLVILLLFLPVPPGPRILGDLLPAVNVLALWIWYVSKAISLVHEKKSGDGEQGLRNNDDMLHYTGSLIETNKKTFGIITLSVAILHFLVPMSVIL